MKSHSDCSRDGLGTHSSLPGRIWSKVERIIRVVLLAIEFACLQPTRIAILLDVWRTLKKSRHREPILYLINLLELQRPIIGIQRPRKESAKRFRERLVKYVNKLDQKDHRKFLEQISSAFGGKDVTDEMVNRYKVLVLSERKTTVSYPDVDRNLCKLMQLSNRYRKYMGCRLEIVCASNSSSHSAEHLEPAFEGQLTAQFYSCELQAAKPSIVFFRRLSAKLDIPLAQTVLIDDNRLVCQRAIQHGVGVVRRMLRSDSQEPEITDGLTNVHDMDEVATAVELAYHVHLVGYMVACLFKRLFALRTTRNMGGQEQPKKTAP